MQGLNNQNGRFQRFQSLNATKAAAPVSPDEFKYGFPSGGLEIVSYKWWGSSSSNDNENTSENGGKVNHEKESKTGKSVEDGTDVTVTDEEKHESETGGSTVDPQDQGTSLLLRVRKEAREEGRKALKLGVYGGYGRNNLGRRERKLLSRIFDSALPSQWSSGSSES